MGFAIPLATPPMEARLVAALPEDAGWQFEPKWDGFRCLVFKSNQHVELRAKSGKSLARYFPDIVACVRALPARNFVCDGELVIIAAGRLSFESLQLRLHPAASRVAKLAAAQPARLLLFDCLAQGRRVLLEQPLHVRRAALEQLMKSSNDCIALSPFTHERRVARRWLASSGRALDGVIAKQIDGPYVSGERAMLKVKRAHSADCVVGGFRYAANSSLVGSLLLGLYDAQGLLHHVGFTSTIKHHERAALTRRLEKLRGSGFTGSAPGAPSRWNTERSAAWEKLRPKLVVEVRYDQVTANRFRHGTKLLRWRADKAPSQCTFEQLAPPAPPAEIAALMRGAKQRRPTTPR